MLRAGSWHARQHIACISLTNPLRPKPDADLSEPDTAGRSSEYGQVVLSALLGSSLLARAAGSQQAPNATPSSRNVTTT